MSSKTVNQLDSATLPLDPSDNILVSRDGTNLNKAPFSSLLGKTIAVNTSRTLLASDNGKTLQITATGVTLTIPAGLTDFGCTIITKDNYPIIAVASTVTSNGSTSPITLISVMGAIVPETTANAYTVIGG